MDPLFKEPFDFDSILCVCAAFIVLETMIKAKNFARPPVPQPKTPPGPPPLASAESFEDEEVGETGLYILN